MIVTIFNLGDEGFKILYSSHLIQTRFACWRSRRLEASRYDEFWRVLSISCLVLNEITLQSHVRSVVFVCSLSSSIM